VRGQTVAGDIQNRLSAGDARRHHPPADRTLQPAKTAQHKQTPGPANGDLATQEKPQEPDSPDQADHPAQLPMAPFPPVDCFEIRQFHPGVLDLELVNLLVFGEFRLPVRLVHRRHGSGKGLPFGDAQATVGQSGQTAHGDHHKDQCE